MKPEVDYYRILGVSESATADEIKRAYRRLAKENHPDSQGGSSEAEERFKEISEAYSVLGNEEKRRQYDMMRKGGFFGGPNGGFNPGQGNPFGGGEFSGNIEDIFGDLFGDVRGGGQRGRGGMGGFKFEDIFTRRGKTSPSPGADLKSEIAIPFELAVNGGETIIKTGGGSKVRIKIPQGIEDGKKIRIRGHGRPSPQGGASGDLYITIRISPHPDFERRGSDIYSSVYINVAEAVLGTEIEAKTVSGKRVKLKIPAGTSSGKVFRLPKLGVKNTDGIGDHFVRIEIDIPRDLSISQRRDFKAWAKKVGLLDGKR